jgi:hypothetical protein
VSHNKLQRFAELPATLELIRVNNNRLASLEGLGAINSLKELWVSDNVLQWTAFLFLIEVPNLHTIVKYGNPSDQKDSFKEFLTATIPSLIMIDGKDVDDCTEAASSNVFLEGVVGKQLLNDARKALLNCEDDRTVGVLLSKLKTLAIAAKKSASGLFNEKQNAERINKRNTRKRDQSINDASYGGKSTSGLNIKDPTVVEGGEQPLRPNYVTSATIEVESNGRNHSDEHVCEKSDEEKTVLKSLRYGKLENDPLSVCAYDTDDALVMWSRDGPIACKLALGTLQCTHKNGQAAGILSNFFMKVHGVSTDASHGGMLDEKSDQDVRASSSINDEVTTKGTGRVANDYDDYLARRYGDKGAPERPANMPPITGSLYDPRGRTLMAFSCPSECPGDPSLSLATVYDAAGKEAHKYTHRNGTTLEDTHEVMGSRVHRFSFQGFSVEFRPSTWDVSAEVATDRARCRFSCKVGFQFIEDLSIRIQKATVGAAATALSRPDRSKKVRGKDDSRNEGGKRGQPPLVVGEGLDGIGALAEKEHDNVRLELDSVMGDLNALLTDLKKL